MGEWYYTDHFASNPAQPWKLTDPDWAVRGQVLNALLTDTDPRIAIQVRYPSIKQRLIRTEDPRAARVGIHDDCFLASPDDYRTFTSGTDRLWLADQTQTVPMGGETCGVNPPRSQWPPASADLAAYHWSFLNADFDTDVLNSWGASALTEARQRLGYRLRLVQATVPTTAPAGSSMSLQLTLTNDGYAAPFQGRPVQLVLRGTTGTFRKTLPLDVRQLQPGQALTVPLQVEAPPVAEGYEMYLALPDSSPSLSEQPAYSIQLANADTWDEADGWNDLQQGVAVTPALTPTLVPTLTPPVPAPSSVWLTGLTPASASNGWGPAERDMSNGEAAALDGHVLSLRGQHFARGIGVRPVGTHLRHWRLQHVQRDHRRR